MQPYVYLAGPDVFCTTAAQVLAHKQHICQRHGLQGLIPLDNDLGDHIHGSKDMALAIYRSNVAMIAQCHAVIANITPFRGPHVDPGTAFEIGYALALGKEVFCYSGDPRPLKERVEEWSARQGHHIVQRLDQSWEDHEHHLIEHFGLPDNLMIGSAMDHLHHPIIQCPDVPPALPAQAAFERIVIDVAQWCQAQGWMG